MSSSQPNTQPPQRTVSLVTLGCARNEVDSEELAARLEAAGWTLSGSDEASVVLVNTCGFIEAAKQESVSELRRVVDLLPRKFRFVSGSALGDGRPEVRYSHRQLTWRRRVVVASGDDLVIRPSCEGAMVIGPRRRSA